MDRDRQLQIGKLLGLIGLLVLLAIFSAKIAPYTWASVVTTIRSRRITTRIMFSIPFEKIVSYDLNLLNTGLILPLRSYATREASLP